MGQPLIKSRFVWEVRSAQDYRTRTSQVSFRIGAAAAKAGVEDSMIQMLGRWSISGVHTYSKRESGADFYSSGHIINILNCSEIGRGRGLFWGGEEPAVPPLDR